MNVSPNAVGLSARQKINFDFKNFFWVFVMLIVLILAVVVTTSGQVKGVKKNLPQTSNQPKVDIKVNRHYDNKGNVIGYDSTYSSYYSNIQGDTIGLHSMLKNFDRHFGNIPPSNFDSYFDKMLFNDTIQIPNYSHQEFFPNQDKWHGFFDTINRQLDSLRTGFYRKGVGDGHKR